MFIEAKDDGGGGDNRSYKSCKAPVKSSPPTNQHPVFYRPDALPVAQPTVSKQWREKSHSVDLLTPSSPGGLPTLSLTTNISGWPWGRVAMPVISPLMSVSQTNRGKWLVEIRVTVTLTVTVMPRFLMSYITYACTELYVSADASSSRLTWIMGRWMSLFAVRCGLCYQFTVMHVINVFFTKRVIPFPSVLWHCWVGKGNDVRPRCVGLLVVTIWLEPCTCSSSSCHHSPPPSSLAPINPG